MSFMVISETSGKADGDGDQGKGPGDERDGVVPELPRLQARRKAAQGQGEGAEAVDGAVDEARVDDRRKEPGAGLQGPDEQEIVEPVDPEAARQDRRIRGALAPS